MKTKITPHKGGWRKLAGQAYNHGITQLKGEHSKWAARPKHIQDGYVESIKFAVKNYKP